jgi:hypothetical protein
MYEAWIVVVNVFRTDLEQHKTGPFIQTIKHLVLLCTVRLGLRGLGANAERDHDGVEGDEALRGMS